MENSIVIFDIDGTLANAEHRLHHILNKSSREKDWDSFYAAAKDDTPISNMVMMIRTLAPHFYTMLLTGRNETSREDTELWLHDHLIYYDELVMRNAGDRRHAGIVKVQKLQEMEIEPLHVMTIFEDDYTVTQSLRNAGFHVSQVADGRYEDQIQKGEENVRSRTWTTPTRGGIGEYPISIAASK